MIAPFVLSLALAQCTITGTSGPDLLIGTRGNDVICGLGGADLIDGSLGNDVIYGGRGTDRIQGGPGRDIMFGGPGNDSFHAWDRTVDRIAGGLGLDRAWTDRLDRVTGVERFG